MRSGVMEGFRRKEGQIAVKSGCQDTELERKRCKLWSEVQNEQAKRDNVDPKGRADRRNGRRLQVLYLVLVWSSLTREAVLYYSTDPR